MLKLRGLVWENNSPSMRFSLMKKGKVSISDVVETERHQKNKKLAVSPVLKVVGYRFQAMQIIHKQARSNDSLIRIHISKAA